VETGRIFGSLGLELSPNFESLRIGLANLDSQIYEFEFVTHDMKQTYLVSGFMTTI